MRHLIPAAVLLALVGCHVKTTTSLPPPTVTESEYLLTAEPSDARPVIAARASAKDGDEVVVVGRIGGRKKPWIEGRASFLLVDASFKACNETGDDGCPAPWDYCCTPADELKTGTATVRIVDAAGQTVATDARQLLGVKELETVVVQGRAKRDAEGNLVVLATGLYRRP